MFQKFFMRLYLRVTFIVPELPNAEGVSPGHGFRLLRAPRGASWPMSYGHLAATEDFLQWLVGEQYPGSKKAMVLSITPFRALSDKGNVPRVTALNKRMSASRSLPSAA